MKKSPYFRLQIEGQNPPKAEARVHLQAPAQNGERRGVWGPQPRMMREIKTIQRKRPHYPEALPKAKGISQTKHPAASLSPAQLSSVPAVAALHFPYTFFSQCESNLQQPTPAQLSYLLTVYLPSFRI